MSAESESKHVSLWIGAYSLLSLLGKTAELDQLMDYSSVSLGKGLGSISRETFVKLLKWEYVDLHEFSVSGLEETWGQFFPRYMAAMIQIHPQCTIGLTSHLMTLMNMAVNEDPEEMMQYDVDFRREMAAMGMEEWMTMYCERRVRKRTVTVEKMM